MKTRFSSWKFIWESAVFLFPLFSEICAFSAALYVKNLQPEHGGGWLMLLAAVKLSATLFEYKGFEEAYLANQGGGEAVFVRIGLLQLTQGVVFPGLTILVAQFLLPSAMDPLFMGLLVWTGVISASRQFLAYYWRSRLHGTQRPAWGVHGEIVGAYAWLGLLTAAALLPGRPAAVLAPIVTLSWKIWVLLVAILAGSFLLKHGRNVASGLSFPRWTASVGHAFTSQLSKEFFIMAATVSLTAGFIARLSVTLYGLVITFPISFFRLKVFDHYSATAASSDDPVDAHRALRKCGLAWSACCLLALPLAWHLPALTRIDFPFAAAVLALGLITPFAAFDALAYFTLLKRGQRNWYSLAAATGGAVSIALGFAAVRCTTDPTTLTLLLVAILGVTDFIINRVSRILANRHHAS